MSFARKAVSFNLENNHQRELLEWIADQSGKNFSGFVKSVLYAHMRGGNLTSDINVLPKAEAMNWVEDVESADNAMNDIF